MVSTSKLDIEDLVTLAVDYAARQHKTVRFMSSWYVFSDTRPGSLQERVDLDAKRYVEYGRMFKP